MNGEEGLRSQTGGDGGWDLGLRRILPGLQDEELAVW